MTRLDTKLLGRTLLMVPRLLCLSNASSLSYNLYLGQDFLLSNMKSFHKIKSKLFRAFHQKVRSTFDGALTNRLKRFLSFVSLTFHFQSRKTLLTPETALLEHFGLLLNIFDKITLFRHSFQIVVNN